MNDVIKAVFQCAEGDRMLLLLAEAADNSFGRMLFTPEQFAAFTIKIAEKIIEIKKAANVPVTNEIRLIQNMKTLL